MSGDSRSPRVGCGAAILRDSKLLLVKRKRPPETNHWGLPGGKVDWLEPVAAAVAREIAEELGLAMRSTGSRRSALSRTPRANRAFLIQRRWRDAAVPAR
jgi:ADP-ribose pyrophosphatase YjhB (NUDIX family)